jgi:prophage maintenance system killer protein
VIRSLKACAKILKIAQPSWIGSVIAIHDHELDGNELQGMASGKFLDGALGRVETRLNCGLVEDVFALAASYTAAIS